MTINRWIIDFFIKYDHFFMNPVNFKTNSITAM